MSDLAIRDAADGDCTKGHIELLSQLTSAPQLTSDEYRKLLAEIRAQGSRIIVVENHQTGTIVASGSLLIERKLIRGGAKVGHIEDVVVHDSCRGKGTGRLLLDHLIAAAKLANCYKVILDCAESNVAFYEKCGFYRKEVHMRLDL